jgi:NADH-quinone oxidoreductase subunit N
VLLLTSVLGMVMMAVGADLISIFVASSSCRSRRTCWRPGQAHSRSNEAGVKYYLLGVFASAVMLYGMSLLFGVTARRCYGARRPDHR